jgi:hypothetical protein
MPEHFTALPEAGLGLPGRLAADFGRVNEGGKTAYRHTMDMKIFEPMN